MYTINIYIAFRCTFSIQESVSKKMREKTCCFTGHRTVSKNQFQAIFDTTESMVKKHIHKGYRFFLTGGALGFDTISALVVLKLKKQYNDIQLILVLPCTDQTRGWSKDNIEIYESIKQKADKVIYTSKEYTRGCMHKRNRYLVDNSSLCICFLTKDKGGTFYTVNYANKQNIKIINIGNAGT